jgi:hypothetical protein
MKNKIIFIMLCFFGFLAENQAQTMHKVKFENDSTIFFLFDVFYNISSDSLNIGSFKAVKNMEIEVLHGEFLNLKFVLNDEGKKNPLNGVSVSDLVRFNGQILGTIPMTTREKLALDVNSNGSISTADFFAINDLILGKTLEFKNSPNWKIYDLESSIGVNNYKIVKDRILKFELIKSGDVNGNAVKPKF